MRCFLGIAVPASLARSLGAPPPGVQAAAATDLHLTLAFLGERDWAWVEQSWRALAPSMQSLEAFSVALTGLAPFPDAHGHIWAAICEPAPAALTALHECLWQGLEAAGAAREKQAFRPHITLGRARQPLTAKPRPGSWRLPVKGVTLYESRAGGAGYRALAYCALAAG